MANEYSIPSTLDTVVLNTSLADYQPTMVDNVYNNNVILSRLKTVKRLVNGGNSLVKIIMTDKQDAGGFYLGADVLNNTQGNFLKQVEYRWQNAYEPIQLTRDEERQNSGDAHKIIDLMATKTKSSEFAIADRLEQALSTPVSGANNLVDLETLVGTGTLGNLSGSTTTQWQATVTTSGAFATQGLADMTTAYYAVSSSSVMDNPTIFITNKTIFQKFEQTRLPLERISDTATATAGWENLMFKGKPLVYGNYISSGLLFGLNMNYINFEVDSATDFITTEFHSPVNQTVKVAYILFRGQMTTTNRRRNFKLQSIT